MLIKLKIGSCMERRDVRAREDLAEVLKSINRAKTHTEREWYFQQPSDAEKFQWLPKYKTAREAAMHVNSQLMSSAFTEVKSKLTSKSPWTNEHKYHWQAIMANDAQLSLYKGSSFAAPKTTWGLGWCGMHAGKNYQVLADLSEHQSQCLFRIALYSKTADSGRAKTHLTFRMDVSKLSAGLKSILRYILNPDHYFEACDSRVVCKDGEWFLHLVYKDGRDLPKLEYNESSCLEVQCNDPKQASGFVGITPTGKRRYFGPNETLAMELARLNTQRRVLQKVRRGNGHGRNKAIAKQKAFTRGKQFLIDRCRKVYISDIVKICKANDLNSVLYREPSLGKGVRSNDWFAEHGINWDWSKFESDLKAKLKDQRIAYVKKRMKLTEYREALTAERKEEK